MHCTSLQGAIKRPVHPAIISKPYEQTCLKRNIENLFAQRRKSILIKRPSGVLPRRNREHTRDAAEGRKYVKEEQWPEGRAGARVRVEIKV